MISFSNFPTKPTNASVLFSIRTTWPVHGILIYLITRIVFDEYPQNKKNVRKQQNNYEIALTLTLLTWRIWWAPYNVRKWQMGFNLALEKLKVRCYRKSHRLFWLTNKSFRRILLPPSSWWKFRQQIYPKIFRRCTLNYQTKLILIFTAIKSPILNWNYLS